MMKKSRVFWIFLMVLAVFFSAGCSKKKSTEPEPEPPKYKWTILGYFDGNNSQDISGANTSYVIKDVQEMEQVGSTEDVKIIVMLGSVKTQGNCYYYSVGKHLDEPPDSISSEVLDSLGKKDMSDSLTLRDFIEYGADHYPAENYMLMINDHGSGWRGVCSDQQNGDGEMMSLPGLSSALSGYNFEVILFNAPSMSMLETAYQLKDNADYLVASQFFLPMQNVLGSSAWLNTLTDDPDISSRDLATTMVEEIYNAARDSEQNVHIAAVKLSGVDNLASKVSALGNALWTNAGAYWGEILAAFNAANENSYLEEVDDSASADLKHFADSIRTSAMLDQTIIDAAQAVAQLITGNVVVKSLSFPSYERRGGLSIHLPWESSLFDSTNYVQLDFASSNWHVFLSHFIPSITGSLASLEIQSTPEDGADIFLNGQDTGLQTNTTIYGLLPGGYIVKVAKSGYPGGQGFTRLESGERGFIRLDLTGGPFSPPPQVHRDLTRRQ